MKLDDEGLKLVFAIWIDNLFLDTSKEDNFALMINGAGQNPFPFCCIKGYLLCFVMKKELKTIFGGAVAEEILT